MLFAKTVLKSSCPTTYIIESLSPQNAEMIITNPHASSSRIYVTETNALDTIFSAPKMSYARALTTGIAAAERVDSGMPAAVARLSAASDLCSDGAEPAISTSSSLASLFSGDFPLSSTGPDADEKRGIDSSSLASLFSGDFPMSSTSSHADARRNSISQASDTGSEIPASFDSFSWASPLAPAGVAAVRIGADRTMSERLADIDAARAYISAMQYDDLPAHLAPDAELEQHSPEKEVNEQTKAKVGKQGSGTSVEMDEGAEMQWFPRQAMKMQLVWSWLRGGKRESEDEKREPQ